MQKYVKEELIILCACKKGSCIIYIIVLLGIISVIGSVSFKVNEVTRIYSSEFVNYIDLNNIPTIDDYITYINEELNKEENYFTLINCKSIEFNKKNITLSLDDTNNIIICKYTFLEGHEKDNREDHKVFVKLKYIIDDDKFIIYPFKDIYQE